MTALQGTSKQCLAGGWEGDHTFPTCVHAMLLVLLCSATARRQINTELLRSVSCSAAMSYELLDSKQLLTGDAFGRSLDTCAVLAGSCKVPLPQNGPDAGSSHVSARSVSIYCFNWY